MQRVLLYDLQSAAITLGVFVCLWGLWEFWRCLWEVLLGRHNQPTFSQCPGHATVALMCIAGLIFAVSRAGAVGLLPINETFAGYAFCGAMIVFTMIIGLTIWAKEAGHSARGPQPLHVPSLSRIFSMMVIIIIAFALVGLVKASM